MTKYAVVALGAPVRPDERFPTNLFPLHVTLLPPTECSSVAELAEVVVQIGASTSPFTLTGHSCALFGPDANIPVTLVEVEPARSLHMKLLDAGSRRGWHPADPQYAGAGYVPHVTATTQSRLEVGDTMRVSTFAIVEMADLPRILSVHGLARLAR